MLQDRLLVHYATGGVWRTEKWCGTLRYGVAHCEMAWRTEKWGPIVFRAAGPPALVAQRGVCGMLRNGVACVEGAWHTLRNGAAH